MCIRDRDTHHAVGGGCLQALQHFLNRLQVDSVVLGINADKVEAEMAHKLRL